MNARTRGEGFGPEVKRRIMIGTYALSAGYYDAYYGQAQKARTLVIRAFDEAYRTFDVLLTPTTPSAAFPFGSKVDDPIEMYLCDLCSIPSNLAGHPAVTVPFAFEPRRAPGRRANPRPRPRRGAHDAGRRQPRGRGAAPACEDRSRRELVRDRGRPRGAL